LENATSKDTAEKTESGKGLEFCK